MLLSLSLTTLESDEPSFVHELRRKLPRYHWRPLAGIRTGEALADLQRICLTYGIRLPTSFALVGKTLSQADSIARTLDPQLDPIALIEEESLELMVTEAEARMEPNQLFSYLFTQLGAVSRLPRRVGAGRGPARGRHAQGGRRPDRARRHASTCCARLRTASAPR